MGLLSKVFKVPPTYLPVGIDRHRYLILETGERRRQYSNYLRYCTD